METLENSGSYTKNATNEIDYAISDNPEYNRVTIDQDSNEIKAINKMPLYATEDLPHKFRYDCRMSCAKETQ